VCLEEDRCHHDEDEESIGVMQTVPVLTLPHSKPLSTYDLKTKEPYRDPEKETNQRGVFCAVEFCCRTLDMLGEFPCSDEREDRDECLEEDDESVGNVVDGRIVDAAVHERITGKRGIHHQYMMHEHIVRVVVSGISEDYEEAKCANRCDTEDDDQTEHGRRIKIGGFHREKRKDKAHSFYEKDHQKAKKLVLTRVYFYSFYKKKSPFSGDVLPFFL